MNGLVDDDPGDRFLTAGRRHTALNGNGITVGYDSVRMLNKSVCHIVSSMWGRIGGV